MVELERGFLDYVCKVLWSNGLCCRLLGCVLESGDQVVFGALVVGDRVRFDCYVRGCFVFEESVLLGDPGLFERLDGLAVLVVGLCLDGGGR